MIAKKKTKRRGTAPPDEMNGNLQELGELALRFPFRWFAQGKVAKICGFGDDVMSALVAQGAPIIARKCNPHLLHQWLEKNLDEIGKIRGLPR